MSRIPARSANVVLIDVRNVPLSAAQEKGRRSQLVKSHVRRRVFLAFGGRSIIPNRNG
jgi:hypothetical protein